MVSIGERNKSRSLSYPFENNRATIIISSEIEKEKKREREKETRDIYPFIIPSIPREIAKTFIPQ